MSAIGVLATNRGDHWSAEVVNDKGSITYTTARPQVDRAIAAAFNGAKLNRNRFYLAHKDANTVHYLVRRKIKTYRRSRKAHR